MFGMSLQKRLRIENLEDKLAPAALSVAVVDGDLVVTGDSDVNDIVIGMFSEPEEGGGNPAGNYFVVTHQLNSGPIFYDGDVFEVNDEGFATVIVTGVTRDVIVNAGEGDDRVFALGSFYVDDDDNVVVKTYVPRDLNIDVGGGNDTVSVNVPGNIVYDEFPSPATTFAIGRDVLLSGGEGDDQYFVNGVVVGDDFVLNDTQGNNLLDFIPKSIFTGPLFFDTAVNDDVNITLGAGTDVASISTTVIGGDVNMNVGGGDDVAVVLDNQIAGNVSVTLGAGVNQGAVENSTVGGSVAISGTGTNEIQVNNMVISSALVIMTNSNSDNVTVWNTTVSSALVATLGGQDNVQIIDSAFDLLIVELGAGNDTLGLTGVDAIMAILSGGGGTDTFEDFGDNDFQLARIRLAFEQFPEL